MDNLQPDFLFSHIEPVKAELMQVMDPKSWYKLNVWDIVQNIKIWFTTLVAYRLLVRYSSEFVHIGLLHEIL